LGWLIRVVFAHANMNKTETITTRSGLPLQVRMISERDGLQVAFQVSAGKSCTLHWGVRAAGDDAWQAPPESLWPQGTVAVQQGALETPFGRQNGQSGLVIRLGSPSAYAFLDFVLFFPDEKQWDNNGGRNYQIALRPSVRDSVRERVADQEVIFERVF